MNASIRLSLRLCIAVALIAALLSAPGPAAASQNEAGLVIRHADGSLTYAWVAFEEPEISGIELLERTGVAVDLVEFGGLGQAVCGIEHRGCAPSECSERLCQGPNPSDPYWRYFRLESDGTWVPFVLGASSAKVGPGDIHGWSWTGSDAQLPVLTLAEIRARSGAADGSVAVRSGLAGTTGSTLGATTAVAGFMLLGGVAAAGFAVARVRRGRPTP